MSTAIPNKYFHHLKGTHYGNPSAALSITTGSGSTITIDDCFIQYMDMIASIIGIEINYEEFSKLDTEARKLYVTKIKRNTKLKKLDI